MRYHGWQTALFGIGANIVARALADDARSYEAQPRVWFAPPAWAFPIAWGVNNAATLWGNLKVLNAPPSADRSAYLRFHAAMWILYLAFGLAYFRLHSRIAGYLITSNFLALATASVPRAMRVDRTLWRSYTTLLPWLVLATVVAHWQTTHAGDSANEHDDAMPREPEES